MIARIVMAAILAAAACQSPPPPTPEQRADFARRAACRQRVDDVFAQQDRESLSRGDDQRYSPFSGNYVEGDTSRGLPQRYARDQALDSCVAGTEDTGPPATDPRRRLIPGS